jgi:hypothetical protein
MGSIQFVLLQIYCYTSKTIALQRFKHRAISGERHPGHVDHLIYDEMGKNLKQGSYELFKII